MRRLESLEGALSRGVCLCKRIVGGLKLSEFCVLVMAVLGMLFGLPCKLSGAAIDLGLSQFQLLRKRFELELQEL